MITRIELENFKGSHKPVIIDLSPLTFLFGPNSAGKSTVIQVLHYAFEVLLKGNLNAGTTTRGGAAIDLGGFRSLVHGHDLARAIRVRLDFTIEGDLLDYVAAEPVERQAVPAEGRLLVRPRPGPLPRPALPTGLRPAASAAVQNKLFDDPPKSEDEATPRLSGAFAEYVSQRANQAAVEFRVRWSWARGEPVVDRYVVRVNDKPMGCIEASADGRGACVTTLNVEHPVFLDKQLGLLDNASSPMAAVLDWDAALSTGGGIAVDGAQGALPLRANRVRFDPPSDAGPAWRNIAGVLRLVLLGPLEVLREQLEGLRYVGPLREVPPRHYEPPPGGDEGRWAVGLGAWDALQRHGELRQTVTEWMAREDRLGSGYGLRLRRFTEVPSDVRSRIAPSGRTGPGPTPRIKDPVRRAPGGRPLRSAPGARRHGAGDGPEEGSGDGEGSGSGSGAGAGAGDGEGSGSGSGAGAGAGAGDGRGSGSGASRGPAPERDKLVLVQGCGGREDGGLEVLPDDVGVGISQLIPVVAAAFDRQATAVDGRRVPVSLVAIEQPELHVHPAIQVGIGDLLIAASKMQQLLIETHSEHVILRVQRRVRETHANEVTDPELRVLPTEVAVVYLDRGKDGALRSTVLRLDEEGRFMDPWPKGFFDERMKELF